MVDRAVGVADVPVWFEGSRLNYAENLLRFNDDRVAIYSTCECLGVPCSGIAKALSLASRVCQASLGGWVVSFL